MMNPAALAPIFTIVLSPNFATDGRAYAVGDAGLRESLDGGISWNSFHSDTHFIQDTPITALALSPNFSSDGTIFAAIQGAMLCSYDTGKHWEVSPLRLPSPIVSTVCVSPQFTQDHTLFVSTLEDGMFVSNNRGKSFERRNFHLYDLSINCVAISSNYQQNESLWIGTEIGIFRSVNGARSWQDLAFPIEAGTVLSLGISRDDKLYAGTESNGIFESLDKGVNWRLINETSILSNISDVIPDENGLLILADGGLYHLELSNEHATLICLYRDDSIMSIGLDKGAEITCLLGCSTGQILNIQI